MSEKLSAHSLAGIARQLGFAVKERQDGEYGFPYGGGFVASDGTGWDISVIWHPSSYSDGKFSQQPENVEIWRAGRVNVEGYVPLSRVVTILQNRKRYTKRQK